MQPQDASVPDHSDGELIASVLAELGREVVMMERDFGRYTRLVGKALGVAMAAFVVVQPTKKMQYIKAQYGFPDDDPYKEEMPLRYSFGRHVYETGRPLIIEATPKSALVAQNPSIAEFGVRSYLGTPVFGRDNRVIGALSALDTIERNWQLTDVQAMKDLSACITVQVKLRMLSNPDLTLAEL